MPGLKEVEESVSVWSKIDVAGVRFYTGCGFTETIISGFLVPDLNTSRGSDRGHTSGIGGGLSGVMLDGCSICILE